MKKLFAVCVTLTLLSGCAVHTREGSVVIDPAVIDDHHHVEGAGTFCPPGQAKKGRC